TSKCGGRLVMPTRSTPPDLGFGSGALSLKLVPSNLSGISAAQPRLPDIPYAPVITAAPLPLRKSRRVHHGRASLILFFLLVTRKIWSRLVKPDCIQSDNIIDAEVFGRIMTLYVIVPDVVDVFPRYRQEGRILFHDGFGLADQRQAFAGVDLPVDP